MTKVHSVFGSDKARSCTDHDPRDPFNDFSDEEFVQLVNDRDHLAEMDAQAADEYAARADGFDEPLTGEELHALAVEAGGTVSIRCPQCGSPDGFIYPGGDGSEFVCPDCHCYEPTSRGLALAAEDHPFDLHMARFNVAAA